jgi:hypothetical protein
VCTVRKFVLPAVLSAVAGLAFLPSHAQASWLSEAIHQVRGDYNNPYYGNYAPQAYPGYDYAPDYSYYTPNYYVPPVYNYAPSYYVTPGYVPYYPRYNHEWREHEEHEHHGDWGHHDHHHH